MTTTQINEMGSRATFDGHRLPCDPTSAPPQARRVDLITGFIFCRHCGQVINRYLFAASVPRMDKRAYPWGGITSPR